MELWISFLFTSWCQVLGNFLVILENWTWLTAWRLLFGMFLKDLLLIKLNLTEKNSTAKICETIYEPTTNIQMSNLLMPEKT